MANISPFPALHYNTRSIGNLAEVITPPYDVISLEKKSHYLSKSPYNFAHIDLAQTENDTYQTQAERFRKWIELGILIKDSTPSYTLYEQAFPFGGKVHKRRTLMGAVLLSEFKDGHVLPHENTHGKYKLDRLKILQATQCQFSQIFGMVKDKEGFIESLTESCTFQAPLLHAQDDAGVEHTIWRLTGEAITKITQFFAEKPIYIVDGHHRYESALAYAKDVGAYQNLSHPASRMLFAIANVYDPALIVLPTHRRIHSLGELPFDWEQLEKLFLLEKVGKELIPSFCEKSQPARQFLLSVRNTLYRCTPRVQESEKNVPKSVQNLAVYWSDQILLKNLLKIEESERSSRIEYFKDPLQMWETRQDTDILIFHSPPQVESVTEVADERGFMPQKSTFFFPKLSAGLILRDLKS